MWLVDAEAVLRGDGTVFEPGLEKLDGQLDDKVGPSVIMPAK